MADWTHFWQRRKRDRRTREAVLRPPPSPRKGPAPPLADVFEAVLQGAAESGLDQETTLLALHLAALRHAPGGEAPVSHWTDFLTRRRSERAGVAVAAVAYDPIAVLTGCPRDLTVRCYGRWCSGSLTYKAGADKVALVSTSSRDVLTNDREYSALGILASSARDRQGDIIECGGVDLRDHARNPIVLWDHGKRVDVPIGMCEPPQGQYTVRYHPDEEIITQKTYFARTPFARQIYSLIRDRFIRANSIAVKDIDVQELEPDPQRGLYPRRDSKGHIVPYKHILTSILAEVTWTPLPANPDAVASLLGKGRINTGGPSDEALDPLIRKSFLPFVLASRAWANGLTMKSGTTQRRSAMPFQPPRNSSRVLNNDSAQDALDFDNERDPAAGEYLRDGQAENCEQLLDTIGKLVGEVRQKVKDHTGNLRRAAPENLDRRFNGVSGIAEHLSGLAKGLMDFKDMLDAGMEDELGETEKDLASMEDDRQDDRQDPCAGCR